MCSLSSITKRKTTFWEPDLLSPSNDGYLVHYKELIPVIGISSLVRNILSKYPSLEDRNILSKYPSLEDRNIFSKYPSLEDRNILRKLVHKIHY
jgi:hypothetical protein